jgi:hypothetical protein
MKLTTILKYIGIVLFLNLTLNLENKLFSALFSTFKQWQPLHLLILGGPVVTFLILWLVVSPKEEKEKAENPSLFRDMSQGKIGLHKMFWLGFVYFGAVFKIPVLAGREIPAEEASMAVVLVMIFFFLICFSYVAFSSYCVFKSAANHNQKKGEKTIEAAIYRIIVILAWVVEMGSFFRS